MAAPPVVQEWDASGQPIQAASGSAPREWDSTGKPIQPTSSAPVPQKGLLQSFSDASGLSTIGHAIAHPIDTANTILDAGAMATGLQKDTGQNPILNAVGSAWQNSVDNLHKAAADYKAQTGKLPTLQVRRDLVNAVPIAGPALQAAQGQYDAGDTSGAVGTILGTAAGLAAPKIIPAVGEALADTDAAAALKMKLRPSSSPAIVPPQEIQAQKIAQSILPPGGIKPEQVSAIQAEAPAVVEYAQRTGNPLNTQAEGLKAAQGVAQEGLQHFNDNILGPVAKDTVNLGAGKTSLGNTATLGQVSDEISSLNKQVNTAKASSAGDALAKMAQKGDVMDQLQYLRGVLYDNLSTKTGIAPADLQSLREGYGGQFTMADALESAQNARLTRTGQASQGVKTIGQPPTSIMDYPSMALNALRGGEQAIADRQFSSAIKGVQPEAPIRPMPNPPTAPGPAVRGMQKWANDGAVKVVQHLQNNPGAGLTPSDISMGASDPAVRQMLINASDLTPGSPAMTNLVGQIKARLGATNQWRGSVSGW